MAAVEEPEAGQPRHHRLGEPEQDREVDDRGEAEREAEALHRAGGEDVEHQRREQRHDLGGQSRHLRALPAGLDRDPHRLALAHLVSDAFEEDDEGVGGDTHRDDETRDAGQGEREARRLTQQQHERVRGGRGGEQRAHHHQAEASVVEEAVDQHQAEAEGPGGEARAQLVAGERGADGLDRGLLERDRERAVAQAGGQRGRRGLGEVAADLRVAVGDAALERRGRQHLPVEHDRELVDVGLQGLGRLGEDVPALAAHLQRDDVLHLALRDAEVGALEVGARDDRLRQQELLRRAVLLVVGVALRRRARDQRLQRVVDDGVGHTERRAVGLGEVAFGVAGVLVELRDRRLVGGLAPLVLGVEVGHRRLVLHVTGSRRRGGVGTRRGRGVLGGLAGGRRGGGRGGRAVGGVAGGRPVGGAARGLGAGRRGGRRLGGRRTGGCGRVGRRRGRRARARPAVRARHQPEPQLRLPLDGLDEVAAPLAGDLDGDHVAALGGDLGLGDSGAVDALVDDRAGLVEAGLAGVALGVQGDPGAAAQVETELRRPAAGQSHQPVQERRAEEEQDEGASRAGRLLRHLSAPRGRSARRRGTGSRRRPAGARRCRRRPWPP